MENLTDRIRQFLSVSDGCGCGGGDGDGSGDGGGVASGYGYISGEGDGGGYGCGVKIFRGQEVYTVDGVATLIDSVHDNYAKGRILQSDFSLVPCFIAKVEGRYFAHATTLHKAFDEAMNKALRDMPVEERIAKFKESFPDDSAKIPATELFDWHNKLTGSCEMGRRNFVRNHGIDLENDSFTVKEFVELTKDDYCGDVIKKILE